MDYRIQHLDEFLIIGQEIELTNSQKENLQISTSFWRKFNMNLKTCRLSQSGHWVKYALMTRRQNQLYYFCAIPQTGLPSVGAAEGLREVTAGYLRHVGDVETVREA